MRAVSMKTREKEYSQLVECPYEYFEILLKNTLKDEFGEIYTEHFYLKPIFKENPLWVNKNEKKLNYGVNSYDHLVDSEITIKTCSIDEKTSLMFEQSIVLDCGTPIKTNSVYSKQYLKDAAELHTMRFTEDRKHDQ